jgi:hypothetical protein
MEEEPAIVVKNDKRVRKQTAQILPPGITQNMMKKYVVYYRETIKHKSGKQLMREYFKVESHPKLSKPWVTSKSTKITILEKLNDANQFVTELDNKNNDDNIVATDADLTVDDIPDDTATDTANIICKRWAKYIPKYTMLRVIRETPNIVYLVLVFDRKDNSNGIRRTGAYTFSCPTTGEDAERSAISLALQHLGSKLREKYGPDIMNH